MTDESMQSGTSVSPCTMGIAAPMSAISSASGSPTLTSSMSAPPASCCATSISSWERSPAWSCAWNVFRPVGLIRSPMTQNGWSGPMTTVLDGDWTTVCTCLPRWYAESLAEAGDAGPAAKAEEVQAGDAGQRARVLGELARDLEALGLGVGGVLTALDDRGRDFDAGDVLVDVAQGFRRADEADGRDERALGGEALVHGLAHERLGLLGPEADLELEEARPRADLLQRAVDAVVERRRAGVLDRSEEQMRRGVDRASGEIPAVRHRAAEREQLDGIEVEDAARLGLVAGGDVVAGEAADVLDPVQRGAGDLGLERDAVAVAAGELHDGLHAELLERDRDGERRCVRVRGGVVGRVRRVDVVRVGRDALVHGVEATGVDGEQLRRDDEASSRECVLKPRHAIPSASACRGRCRD